MKLKELKEILNGLPEELDELEVEFGPAYPNMTVESVEVLGTHIEICM